HKEVREKRHRIRYLTEAVDYGSDTKAFPEEQQSQAKSLVREAKRDLQEAKQDLKTLKPPEPEPYTPDIFDWLLRFEVSFALPHRNEHCHILGAPGTGKTELIKLD